MRDKQLSSIKDIAESCGGAKRYRNGFMCLCPCHDDKEPSCSVRLGASAVLIRCFKGCATPDILDHLRAKDFVLSLSEGEARSKRDLSKVTEAKRVNDRDTFQRTKFARALWAEAKPIKGTLAERYLIGRGLLPSMIHNPNSSLRFHPNCPYGKECAPSMIAAYRDLLDDTVVAIHRTILTPDGKKITRMMLGPTSEAAIKLWPHQETFNERNYCQQLFVGEGIETCLAAMALGYRPVWAMGTAGLIAALPPMLSVRELIVLADHDPPGIKAAEQAVQAWREAGWIARYILPEQPGFDFADVVQHEGVAA